MAENIIIDPEEHYRPNTINDTIIYLNQQLSACGYHFPLDFFNNKDEKSIIKIVECISALLQQQQKDTAYREEMHDQHQKLQSDYELLTFTIKTLKTRAELSEREVDTLRAKLIKIEDHLQIEFEKHRSTKDELTKTKANLQNVKSQAMHDIRKRETEYTRFKEKMQKLLSDKYHSTCGPQDVNPPRKQLMKSMNYATPFINYAVDAPIVSGGLNYVEKNSEKIKQDDGDADVRDKDLLLENSKLRKLLFEVHNQVTSFIGSQTQMRFASIDPELASLKTPESYNSRAAHTQLPFELFAQNLEEEVKDLLLALKFEWDNRPVLEDFQQKDGEIWQKNDEIRQKNAVIKQKDVEIRQKYDEIRQKDDEIRQKDDEIRQKDDEIRQKDDVIKQKDDVIKQKDVETRQKDDKIRQKDNVIQQKDDVIKQKDAETRQKDDKIRQKDNVIQQKDDVIRQMDNAIQQKDDKIRQKDDVIRQMDDKIRQKDDVIRQMDNVIQQKDDVIRKKDDKIRQKNDEIKKKEEMICTIYEM
ncbi:13031_t:CDS:2, partial [Dentiscutata erythropus]